MSCRVEKIISGGQTGADQGGLEAAVALGIVTGGCAPRGYRTEKGSFPILKYLGLDETAVSGYRQRTRLNAQDSDGTVLFGSVSSPGSKLTLSICTELGKPYLVNPSKDEFLSWLIESDISVLNVAGNRESKNRGIQERVHTFLVDALWEDVSG